MTTAPRHIGVIGSGVAGLTAAYVASRTAHVTLFEADDRLGGHADTHVVPSPAGSSDPDLRIDTGFIVHNRRTYPTLLRLFAELGIATQPSEMSLSVSDRGTGVEFAGALGARGLFPTRSALRSLDHWRMLASIPRFHRQARRLLAATSSVDGPTGASTYDGTADQTLRSFLDEGGFSEHFVRHFMEPLVAAVWSCDPETSLDYPARYLFTFLEHHGMLGVFGSPEWRTVTGGSGTYVDAVATHLQSVRTGTKITSVRELDDRVEVTDGNGRVHSFDAIVIATHPFAGADHARVADGRPDRGPRLAALLRQHRAPAHRHLAAAGGAERPVELELPASRHPRPAGSPSPTT
ncbi:NAD(P)/FAD-dependent oxidoreductase [Nocardioides sp. B-3]|uniref:NAD(P)/FAD-dependent oxidoreductase n=1 Tax=Nocardioides sp. B-3 TaxID=2895565 RepID=UPI0021531185|nr:FAD-dependent oxidoreductase [Nocardioides sp. B-3]UUZ61273.1 FAD-dependent oxidoreductase [Nocardioides sp. B-3]